MKGNDRICIKVLLKSMKQRQIYLRREENYIEGTPKIIVGKLQNNIQQIWIDDLKIQPIARLKQLNSDEKAFNYAKTIIYACFKLAPRYGYFIINQNMIFFNPQKEIFAWINPEIIQNQVKIYLPLTPQGQLTMTRSIITYLKLWLKCDYNFLSQSKKLEDLLNRFQQFRSKMSPNFKPRSPERDFLGARNNSQLLQGDNAFNRYSGNNLRLPAQNQLIQNRSNRQIKSPGREQEKLVMSMSYKQKNILMKNYQSSEQQHKLKNRTQSHNTDHISSDKNAQQTQGNFEHKSFHNINQSTKLGLNQSLGLKSQKYFPNRTTSNKSHPIVQYVRSQDQDPNQYKQNKILLQDSIALEQHLQRQRQKKMKQSLDGIGQQVNELFFSNIESDGNKEEQLKQIQQQFESLLD